MPVMFKVEAASFGGKPQLPHGRLNVDDDFRAALKKFDIQHIPVPSAFNINVRDMSDIFHGRLNFPQSRLGKQKEFRFSHATLQWLSTSPF